MGQDLNQECMVMDPTLNKMVYSPLATQCENKNSDLICEMIMGSVNVTTGSSGPRASNCYKGYGEDGKLREYPQIKQDAITYCLKKCGYCCISSAFSCKWTIPEGYTPEIEQICKEATQDQCRFSITNRPIYARYCPNTCGFCTMNSCIDAVSVCDKDPLICTAPELKEFAEKYCQRSCGFCTK
ncbi:hypothetical protein CAEBREN_16323 [Caenorhabditis brenneri]|uniref:ShKT domain-containing protein n=1 Tax=Caenorhabditis brenneri TaxID=135651 RepID=G0NCA5_CAEBE|nr:hypothetical protein CAEBREN_16323 [Caenorhabditis brenneri]